MCLTCGCLFGGKGNKLRFKVEGYSKESIDQTKRTLLGLPGVYSVHIHAHDGETTINYNPAKTSINDLTAVFTKAGLIAIL